MKNYLLILFITMALASCKSNTPNKEQSSDAKDEKVIAPSAKGRYAVKSGIVEYKSKTMGFDAAQTLYFDDYGAKEANYITMEMMGMKINTNTITKDGYVYNFDPDKKTGSKTPVLTGSNINFEDLSDQVMKDWNMKKMGKEMVAGKDCEKYSLDNQSMNIKGFYWVWKGIALKMDADMSSMKMLMEAINIQDNVNVPSEKFAVPADITFQ